MKKINISTKKHPNTFVMVDDEDFKELNKFKWHLSDSGYALRRIHVKGSGRKNQKNYTIRMHRIINNTPRGLITDHRNQNKLDNTRKNLRTANKSLNGINRGKQKNNSSGYKGVYWHRKANKWMVDITIKGKYIYLGLYVSIEDAINARKKGEKKYHAI